MASEEPYSKRELDEKFASLERRLFHEDEGFLPRIEAQTTATNGKVKKIIIALVALFFFSLGLGFQQAGMLIPLLL